MRRRHRKRLFLSDPMILTLALLLVFLTAGSFLFGSRVKRIALDAAYGGESTGYAGIVKEADVSAAIVKELRNILLQDSRFEVFETHPEGADAGIRERLAKVHDEQADLLLSIHASGSADISEGGMQVSALPPSYRKCRESLRLAQCIASEFSSEEFSAQAGYLYYSDQNDGTYTSVFVPESDSTDHGNSTWDLLEYSDCPGVISDQFFVSNGSDVKAWADEAGYEEAARNLYRALCGYYGWNPKEDLS